MDLDYPWSLVSDPYRKPVVAEIGHTIMSVLNVRVHFLEKIKVDK